MKANDIIKKWPLLLFAALTVISLFASFQFPNIVKIMVSFLMSSTGEVIVPRLIIGFYSSLLIAAYITEKLKGRADYIIKYVQTYFTITPMVLGFYTLSRWLFLDIYSDNAEKFLPYISKLEVSAFLIALILLLTEAVQMTTKEFLKLFRQTSGVRVKAED